MYVSRRKIQKLMDNSKRAGMTDDGKKLGEFDLVDRLARTELKKQHVCLYYRKDDSTAPPAPGVRKPFAQNHLCALIRRSRQASGR